MIILNSHIQPKYFLRNLIVASKVRQEWQQFNRFRRASTDDHRSLLLEPNLSTVQVKIHLNSSIQIIVSLTLASILELLLMNSCGGELAVCLTLSEIFDGCGVPALEVCRIVTRMGKLNEKRRLLVLDSEKKVRLNDNATFPINFRLLC